MLAMFSKRKTRIQAVQFANTRAIEPKREDSNESMSLLALVNIVIVFMRDSAGFCGGCRFAGENTDDYNRSKWMRKDKKSVF
ncbi:hypothetical protein EDM56_05485 [Brevibacillus fluminis]|uniref:Uncharacterized protein n=1 Tax=Brevibacillus fluminis TaxID=511487 RepID=A0A3M8DTJ4_9BACL|nr:hypothetical protein [Brevibacillus fluminis]RNB91488.1 hypothetical protein EDM56_05485 [Brevibacillus fluminis]